MAATTRIHWGNGLGRVLEASVSCLPGGRPDLCCFSTNDKRRRRRAVDCKKSGALPLAPLCTPKLSYRTRRFAPPQRSVRHQLPRLACLLASARGERPGLTGSIRGSLWAEIRRNTCTNRAACVRRGAFYSLAPESRWSDAEGQFSSTIAAMASVGPC